MKIKVIVVIIFAIALQGCYTQVQIPKNTETVYEPLREIEFYKKVVRTFDNNFPDYGYYYEFQPSTSRSDVINKKLFLEKLYSEGYNIIAAWYRPKCESCNREDSFFRELGIRKKPPVFIILLSNVDDSIINYNFHGLTEKPFIECPYSVEVYTIQ